MDEHHGEATKTSVLWKKLNSTSWVLGLHPQGSWKYLLNLTAGRRYTCHRVRKHATLTCFRTGMVPGVSTFLMLRVDDGVEVTLVRNHLK